MHPTVIILSGIPLAGKSTWAEEKIFEQHLNEDDFRNYRILCRDTLRLHLYKTYSKIPFTKQSEKFVNERFNNLLAAYTTNKLNIIIDQTNCKEVYLKDLLKYFENTDYKVQIKFFDIPLWKAFYRNIIRYRKTGKYIPWKVLKTMKRNYDNIDKSNYNVYK